MPEHRGVALAAIIVAGVVGVAGPLITWRATRDTQQSAAAAEVVRGDRADLRRILDKAAFNLERAAHTASGITLPWEHATEPLSFSTLHPLVVRTNAVEFSTDQLRIRLGPGHPVLKPYADALLQLQRLVLKYKGPPVAAAVELATENRIQLYRDRKRFRAEAHEVAGSTLG